MSGLIQKYSDINTHPSVDRANELLRRFQEEGPHAVQLLMAGSADTGAVVLIDSPGEPHCVLEVVTSMGGLEDTTPAGIDYITESTAISALYRAHPLFSEPNKLIEARREIIGIVNDFASAMKEVGPKGAVIRCPVRGIAVYAKDLTFMQLLDVMKFCTAKMFH